MSRSPSVMLDENQQSQSPSHTLGPNTILDSTKATTIPPVSPAPPPAASSSTIQQQQFPTWAQRTDTARHKRARVILTDPTIIYPLGSGCPSCVSKGFQCVAKEGYAVCARCTADAYGVPRCGVGFTPWRTVAGKKKKAAPKRLDPKPPVRRGGVKKPKRTATRIIKPPRHVSPSPDPPTSPRISRPRRDVNLQRPPTTVQQPVGLDGQPVSDTEQEAPSRPNRAPTIPSRTRNPASPPTTASNGGVSEERLRINTTTTAPTTDQQEFDATSLALEVMNVWNGANPRTLLHRLLQENSKLRETIKRLESSAARETVTRLESSAASERNRKRTRVPDDDDDDGEYVG